MKQFLVFSSFLLLVFAAPLHSAQAQKPLLNIQEITSPNGSLSAWLVEDHSVPVITMKISFRDAGAAQDTKNKQGLTRLASNTMDEGAGNIKAQAFQKELRDLAISLHFTAGRDHFGATLKTLSKNKKRAFELLKLSVTKPRFDKAAVNRMKDANQSRIRSALSDPKWMAARLLNDKAFEGHPYAMNSGGTLSSLPRIKPADLKKFHKARIGKNNLVIAVAGDITATELGVALDDIFGSLPDVTLDKPKAIDIQNEGGTFLYQRDIPQTIIEIMQTGIARNDPDYHTAQIMNFILGSSGFGSRLTEEAREKKGLTYGIYSYLYTLDQMQALAISTSTANENVPEMLGLIRSEFQKMKDTPVSVQELKEAKSYLIGSVPLALTSTSKIAGFLLSLRLDSLPLDYLDQRSAAITKTTIQDIQTLAQHILQPEKFTSILVGAQQASIENIIQVKDLPNVQ